MHVWTYVCIVLTTARYGNPLSLEERQRQREASGQDTNARSDGLVFDQRGSSWFTAAKPPSQSELGRRSGEVSKQRVADVMTRHRRDVDGSFTLQRTRDQQLAVVLIQRLVAALSRCARTGDCPDLSSALDKQQDAHNFLSKLALVEGVSRGRPMGGKRSWLRLDDREWEKRERQLRPLYNRQGSNDWNDAMRNAWG